MDENTANEETEMAIRSMVMMGEGQEWPHSSATKRMDPEADFQLKKNPGWVRDHFTK